jgi:rubrerythrin
MDARLGAFEILTMAQQIERDSVDFYRRAASIVDGDDLRSLFSKLADWEKKHEEVFEQMKRDMSEKHDSSMKINVESYISSNPQQLRSLAKSAIKNSPEDALAKIKDKVEILKLAFERETEAIKFFRSLVGHLRDLTAKKKVKDILDEEKKHLSILTQSIETFESRNV